MDVHGSQIAFEIATDILTVGSSEGLTECVRAEMKHKPTDGVELGLGGRNKQSIMNCVDAVLKKHGIGVPYRSQ